MNVNELADLIGMCGDGGYNQDAAIMLRQQQAEIDRAVELYTDKAIKVEQLEKELTEAGGMIGVLREYISDLEKGLDSSIYLNKAQAERQVKETLDTRSYLMGRYDTSPVKELTDEEIQLLINDVRNYDIDTHDLFEFARAILRKAQEK